MAVDQGAGSAEEASAKAPARPFRITTPTRSDRRIKGLFYGPYGIGKTTLVATAADVKSMRDVIFLDAEAGDMSLATRDNIDVVPITNFKQFSIVHEFLRIHCRLRDAGDIAGLKAHEARFLDAELIRERPRMWRTVVIDSLTEVQRFVMQRLMGIEPGKTALDTEFATPEFKDWNQSAEAIRLLVRSFRDLSMNVLFVCSEMMVEDERKQQHRRPNLPGKLSLEVLGFMDVVGYITENGVDQQGNLLRRVYLQPQKLFQAKSRLQHLKDRPFLENPTMADLVDTSAVVPPANANGSSSGHQSRTRSA